MRSGRPDKTQEESTELRDEVRRLTSELLIKDRDLRIESALEQVRSVAIAMKQSAELLTVIGVVFEEMQKLEIAVQAASINILIEGSKDIIVYACGRTENGLDIRHVRLSYFDHPIANDLQDAYKKGLDFFVGSYGFEEKNRYYEHQFQHSDLRNLPAEIKERILQNERYELSMAPTKHSTLIISNFEGVPLTTTEVDLLKRFARVFEQAYTRFLDLQKAEANAREATIEAALEKVRSRSLAVNKSDDFKEVIGIVFEKMQELGIQATSVSINTFIKGSKDTEVYISGQTNGNSILSHFRLIHFDHPISNDRSDAQKRGVDFFSKTYNAEETNSFYKYQFEVSDLKHVPGEIKKMIFGSKLYTISMAVTKNSMIVVNDFDGKTLSEDEIQIVKRFAKVFEQCYIRFLDLQNAEALALQAAQDLIEIKAAKQKAEVTLNELQATQKQLIQSEKMASLGELTAGIAHEIQNPLNFVNNFSEVSKELLDEMKDALEKGDAEEAKEIADALIQNMEKINSHGKRADGIVKGMLQHSRSTGTTKEPTDINKLVDEYLRLAYHGLRAKDKSFNATLKTDYDETLSVDEAGTGNVHIVPQDIGRVILNLITNAFYALSAKASAFAKASADKSAMANSNSSYEPTVTIITKKLKDTFEITVCDNGDGIPKNIIDKIFQPFFTTKPTGQGTGLGLSLAYDIVTAHGGKLMVETEDGKGTAFKIQLPITS